MSGSNSGKMGFPYRPQDRPSTGFCEGGFFGGTGRPGMEALPDPAAEIGENLPGLSVPAPVIRFTPVASAS
jgi:hypothetical protein